MDPVRVTQWEIARRIGIDVSSVNKILNCRKGSVFRKETVRKVFKAAQELGYDFSRLKFQHRRRYPRKDMNVSSEVCIYRKDGVVHDRGMATIREISACGARISDLILPRTSLPADPFRVSLKPMEKPFDGLEIPGRLVRIHQNGQYGFGIEFTDIDPGVKKRLLRLTAR